MKPRCTCEVCYTQESFKEFTRIASNEVGTWTLLRLKDPEWLEQAKHLEEILPFRPASISACKFKMMYCCGSCFRNCSYRCVQDIYTKLNLMYAAEVQKKSALANIIFATLSNPDVTYSQLIKLFNDIVFSRRDEPYVLDYTPQYVYTHLGKDGRKFKKVNKQTGELLIRPWPETGLCPYCQPNYTIQSRYYRRPRKDGGTD